MKLPTTKQWDKIAEALNKPKTKRSKRERLLTRNYGICHSLLELNCDWHGFYEAFQPEYFGWWWPRDDAGDRERAFFCCMMAAITEAGDMEKMIEEA